MGRGRKLLGLAGTVVTAVTLLVTLRCRPVPVGRTGPTDAAAAAAEAAAVEGGITLPAASEQRAARAAREVEVQWVAAAPFVDVAAPGLTAPIIWATGESHIIHLEWVIELEGSQNITPGLGAGLSKGGGPVLWSAPPPWHANSGYSGTQTFQSQALIDAEVPIMSPGRGVTYGVFWSGSNDCIVNDTTNPATRAMVVSWWSASIQDQLALSGMAPADFMCISPVLSTNAALETKLAALRPDIVALCASLGVTYVDLMAGPDAIVAGDVSGDQVHLTSAGYTKAGKTIARARGYVVL